MPTITVLDTQVHFDPSDADLIGSMNLSISRGQVRTYDKGLKAMTGVARILMQLTPGDGEVVWFKDRNPANLSRENMLVVPRDRLPGLRASRGSRKPTPEGIARMRDLSRNPNAKRSGTGYHGVSLHRPSGRFHVRFRPPGSGKTESYGYFAEAEDAAREYDRIRVRFGLMPANFPEE